MTVRTGRLAASSLRRLCARPFDRSGVTTILFAAFARCDRTGPQDLNRKSFRLRIVTLSQSRENIVVQRELEEPVCVTVPADLHVSHNLLLTPCEILFERATDTPFDFSIDGRAIL